MEPLTRVNIKLLEQDVEALRRKLQLHKNVSVEQKEVLQNVANYAFDPEQDQLIHVAAQKNQIVLQLEAGLNEVKSTQEELNENLKNFKVACHLKSIKECGEMIFDMRRLKAQYNIYVSFKLDQDRFRKNYNQLGELISTKLSAFMKNVQEIHSHVREQQVLIVRDIQKKLSEEAFRIGLRNMGGTTQRYIRAKQNNSELINHIALTQKQHRYDEKASNESKMLPKIKIKSSKVGLLVEEVERLRRKIDSITKHITLLKRRKEDKPAVKRKRGSKASVISHPIITCNNVSDCFSELETYREELEREKSVLETTKSRYTSMRKNYVQMLQAKHEIEMLANMVINFRQRPCKVLYAETEKLFIQNELANFLDNIFEAAKRPLESFKDEPSLTKSKHSYFSATSKSSLVPSSGSRKLSLSVPSYFTLTPASSATSLNFSNVIDVESDVDSLSFIYEISVDESIENVDEKLSAHETVYTNSSY